MYFCASPSQCPQLSPRSNLIQSIAINRTAFTYLAYINLGFFAYLLAVFGPIMPFLQDELKINYSIAGLHVSALALGMSLAGTLGERISARFGRPMTFWLGGGGMCLGALCLVFGQSPYITIFGSFIMGLLGGNLMIMVQASLGDQFGENRTIALTESNVVAVIFQALVPIIVFLGIQFIGGWRLALWFAVAIWLISYLLGRKLEFPAQYKSQQDGESSGKLPARFWLYCFVLALGVAVEWCVGFWTPAFLERHVLLSKDTASLMMSIFFVAMIIGRIIGSRLSYRFPAIKLLFAAQLLSLLSFPLLWLSWHPIANGIGLFLVGLSIANFFPLCLSVILHIGQAQPDKASARVSQAAGLAMLTVPLLLGNVADNIGIFLAFGIGMVLLILLPIIVGVTMKRS
jgi:fucose permease